MLPKLHPLAKTAIETRRALLRLENYVLANPSDPYVKNGTVGTIMDDLKSVRAHVPKELKDVDLMEVSEV